MRLILIRHGETEHNRGNLTLGRFDAPLNERGRAQALAVAASFTVPPDAIHCSPLSRARDTAEAIGAASGVAVTVDDGLIEMDVGEMEHLTGIELRERYPEFLGAWLADDAAELPMPGGESLRRVQERAWATIERMRANYRDGTVVAVTHNFVILMVICRAIGLPPGQFRRLRQALAARSVLEIHDKSATLLQLNDIAHLIEAGLADDLLVRRRGDD